MSFSCLECVFNSVQEMRGFLYPNGFRCLFSLILEMEERTKAELHAFLSLAALVIPSMGDAFLDLSLCTWSFLFFFLMQTWWGSEEPVNELWPPWVLCFLAGTHSAFRNLLTILAELFLVVSRIVFPRYSSAHVHIYSTRHLFFLGVWVGWLVGYLVTSALLAAVYHDDID